MTDENAPAPAQSTESNGLALFGFAAYILKLEQRIVELESAAEREASTPAQPEDETIEARLDRHRDEMETIKARINTLGKLVLQLAPAGGDTL